MLNPFIKRTRVTVQPVLDNKFVCRVSSLEIDRETLAAVPVYEAVDIQEQIQSCKDLCGLEYMKKLLASGQVSPEDLADNSGTVVDLSDIPDNQHEALRRANAINENIGKYVENVGGEEGKTYTSQEIETMIKTAIEKHFANSSNEGDTK